tara:strand:+ start:1664 stop:1936 length:273 start_codon:yes stop_codon:yes gene_type:complete
MENDSKISMRIDAMNPKFEVEIQANNVQEVKELLDYAIVNIRTPQTTTNTSVLPDLTITPSSNFQVSPISDKEITISSSDYEMDSEGNTF